MTKLLHEIEAGDSRSAERLLPLVYDELRRVARRRMARTPPGQTLTPTALVHEAYVKLIANENKRWEGQRHFFLAASQAMRTILIDQARSKAALKRGRGYRRQDLDDIALAIEPPAGDVVELDEALHVLEREEPEAAEVVTMHYFAGLSLEEIATVQELSLSTVRRRWRFARAWLHRALSEEGTGPQPNSDG